MATAKVKEPVNTNLDDQITMTVPEKEPEHFVPTADIFLPEIENSGSSGLKVDQYEHVSVGNMVRDNTDYVRRGERNSVSVSTFLALKEKYPKI